MAIREIDAITDAVIETEREIAGEAWGQEDTERADATGDRGLESMGDGLEGQHEAADDEDAEGETEGDEESEAEGEGEAETVVAAKAKDGEVIPPEPKPGERQPEGRVPPGKHREALERARAAETERDALKAQIEKTGGENKSLADRLDLVMREIEGLKRGPAPAPRTVEPPKAETVPDIFEDPKGFVDHITKGFQTELSKRDQQAADSRVETSMAIAHAFHKDTFSEAFAAINKLDPTNPDDRSTVQRIYRSPNPGEALVSWHKRSKTLAEVGDDPTAFRERVAKETREALMKDPEFKKQLIADMRGEAARGDDGTPRTTNRLPPNLHRAPGSNLSVDRGEASQFDDSDQAVAASAWR